MNYMVLAIYSVILGWGLGKLVFESQKEKNWIKATVGVATAVLYVTVLKHYYGV